MNNDPRLSRLEKVLAEIAPDKRLAIAFSGGLDSRFLSFAAKYLGYTVKLLTVRGPHISAEETAEAVQWAQDNGFEMELLDLNPLQMKAVEFNHTDRCYFCKKHLFLELKRRAADLPLCDGTNHSDLSHYRPGLKALSELKIHSPLAEAEFSKQDNREVGALIGLDHWDQAARPCMLTRLETFEMHIQREDFKRLSEEERTEAEHLLASFPLFASAQWKPMEKLSGYFDRLLGQKAH